MCGINVLFMHRHTAEKLRLRNRKKASFCQYENMARYFLDFKQLRGGGGKKDKNPVFKP